MILVAGGTGFVGRHLVARLVEAGEEVRVFSRRPASIPGCEVAAGDIRDPSAIAAAAQGCRAVVHLVGIIRERRGASFREIHVEGTRAVLRGCEEAQVGRLLHMSALGTRAKARSRYHRSKWEAEELVRGAGVEATIFRPSAIFGAGSAFMAQIRGLVRRSAVIPVIGRGTSLLQPIWVGDVVTCFLGSLGRPAETAGRTYELGGPATYGFEQLVDLLAEAEGISKPKVHVPAALMRPVAAAMSRLMPGFPVTPDQLTMLLEDNTCDIAEMRATFGIEPACIREHLNE